MTVFQSIDRFRARDRGFRNIRAEDIRVCRSEVSAMDCICGVSTSRVGLSFCEYRSELHTDQSLEHRSESESTGSEPVVNDQSSRVSGLYRRLLE
jgi:hypothetical protein